MSELEHAESGRPAREFEASARPTRPRAALRLASIFATCFVLILGAGLLTSRISGNSSSSSNSSAMASWFTSYGANYQRVATDDRQIAVDSSATGVSPSTLRADCGRLGAAVATAKSNPPMPDPALEPSWSAILVQLQRASQLCVSGIDQQSVSLLNQAGDDISNAASKYGQLLKGLGANN